MAAIAPTQVVPHLDGGELEPTDIPIDPGTADSVTEPQALPAAPRRRALT